MAPLAVAAAPPSAQALPPPASGQFLEVSFRRLLRSCEEIAAGDSKGRADLVEWQTSPVFHHVRRAGLPPFHSYLFECCQARCLTIGTARVAN